MWKGVPSKFCFWGIHPLTNGTPFRPSSIARVGI